MAREERRGLPVRYYSRPGEGVIIETSRKMIPLPNGTSSFEISLDMGSAPVPERKYVANTASVTFEGEFVSMLFGQHTVGTRPRRLRTLIVISVSSAGALSFLKSLEPISAQLKILREQLGSGLALEDIEEEPPAPQTVALAANLIVLSFSGREAVIDYYHASPYVLSQLQMNGKLAVDPVVRVILPSGLLLSIIAKVDALKEKFPLDELERAASADVGQVEARRESRNVR
jgi:hypothetical protein